MTGEDEGINTKQNQQKLMTVKGNFSDWNEIQRQKLSSGLLERSKVYMQLFDIDAADIEKMTPDFVSVKIEDSDVIARVLCAVCKNDRKGKQVYYRSGEGSNYWVLSNLGTHFKKVHKLKSRPLQNELSHTNKRAVKRKRHTLRSKSIETSIINKSDDKSDMKEPNDDEQLALAHNFSVEYVHVSNESIAITSSNGSDIVFDQITTQIRKMMAATLSHNDNTDEMYFVIKHLEFHSLKFALIPPDGSCLFGSLSHQLFGHKIKSTEHTESTKMLRKNVVEHIRQNYESFKFELQGRVYEEINSNAKMWIKNAS